MKKYSYDTKKYCFAEEIKKLFGVRDLSLIHKQWSEAKMYDLLDDVETDQNTDYHKTFYECASYDFYKMYESFLEEEIFPLFDEPVLYQEVPTFRVHQPQNIAVAAFHCDKEYSHVSDEVNIFLPLTEAKGNTTIWAESEAGKADYKPMEADYGEFYLWDGANLTHGNKVNDSDVCRVSIDFRVLPKSKYINTQKVSTSKNMEMSIGNYWKDVN